MRCSPECLTVTDSRCGREGAGAGTLDCGVARFRDARLTCIGSRRGGAGLFLGWEYAAQRNADLLSWGRAAMQACQSDALVEHG